MKLLIVRDGEANKRLSYDSKNISFESLQQFIQKNFSSLQGNTFQAYYIDDEGDKITIDNDEDMKALKENITVHIRQNLDNSIELILHKYEKQENQSDKKQPRKLSEDYLVMDRTDSNKVQVVGEKQYELKITKSDREKIILLQSTLHVMQQLSSEQKQEQPSNNNNNNNNNNKVIIKENSVEGSNNNIDKQQFEFNNKVKVVQYRSEQLKSIFGGETQDYREICLEMETMTLEQIIEKVLVMRETEELLKSLYSKQVRQKAKDLANILQIPEKEFYQYCKDYEKETVSELLEKYFSDDQILSKHKLQM